MISIAVMTVLVLLAILAVTRPWWQRQDVLAMQRRSANVAVYQTRLAEIEADQVSGLLEAPAAQALKDELAARLVKDADGAAPSLPMVVKSRLWWPVLLLPVFAGVWYALEGSWKTQNLLDLARSNPAAAQQLSVDDMVQRLASRLEESPEDPEGWAMLGRSYNVMQRHAEAAMAYGKANALSGAQNADWLLGEGEALALAHDRNLQGKPLALFEAALKLQPDSIGALWYAGLAYAQSGDYGRTRVVFEQLQSLDLPPDLREVLSTRLQELAKLTGEPLSVPPAQASVPERGSGVVISMALSIAPELQSQQEGRTLFVFAKAEQGPPMPLAVQRLAQFELPMSLKLDESMGVMPTMKLSQFDRWIVTARLTRSGNAQAEPGDLEGSVTVSRAALSKPVALRIDRKIP